MLLGRPVLEEVGRGKWCQSSLFLLLLVAALTPKALSSCLIMTPTTESFWLDVFFVARHSVLEISFCNRPALLR